MIRLCLLSSGYEVGGVEMLFYELFQRLDRQKFQVEACLLRKEGNFVDLMRAQSNEGVRFFDSKFVLAAGALKYLGARSFDVIHSFGFRSDLIAAWYKRTAERTVLVSSIPNPDLPNSFLKHQANRWMAGMTDSYWADCRYRASAGAARLAIPAEKVSIIYPGVQADPPARANDSARAEIGLPSNSLVIGALGNLRFIKGHDLLLKAAPLVLKEIPQAYFVFIGKDFSGGKIPRLAEEAGLTDRVKFFGYRHDPLRTLAAMTVLVQPSRSEGLPRAVLEAMSAGVPVIAGRVGGIPELIQDRVTGYLIPPDDVETLAAGIIEVVSNSNLACAMANEAREEIRRRFSVEQMVKNFEKLYSEPPRRQENKNENARKKQAG